MRELLQSKIHKATVTEANLEYIGSITIDEDLLEKIDLWEGQKVEKCLGFLIFCYFFKDLF